MSDHYITSISMTSRDMALACRCGALSVGLPFQVATQWRDHLNFHGVRLDISDIEEISEEVRGDEVGEAEGDLPIRTAKESS